MRDLKVQYQTKEEKELNKQPQEEENEELLDNRYKKREECVGGEQGQAVE